MEEKKLIDYVRLIRSENVGPATFFNLLKLYGSPASALEHIPELARTAGRTKKLSLCTASAAKEEIEKTKELGAEFIAFSDDDYPFPLKQIPDAPPLITVLGHRHLLAKDAVAIVGTRDASLNGRNMAKKLGYELASHGYVVVSGMALGIDSAAHEGALAAEDSAGTIAVLGTGIETVYPSTNRNLYDRIRSEGLLVTEFEYGSPIAQSNFPRRNRIISGLSQGVVVVEARAKSGSLITANLALEQGREVMAIPGTPLDPRCAGTNHLLKNGASLIETPQDVIDTIKGIPSIREEISAYQYEDEANGFAFAPTPISQDDIKAAEAALNTLLGNGAVALDDLIRQSGCKTGSINQVLTAMELAGKIERLAGGYIVATPTAWEDL